jgi:hypothetical protein
MTGAEGAEPASDAAAQPGTGDSEAADRAWVRVATPLTPPALRAFITDVERLLRINPMLEVETLEELSEGHYRIRGLNLATGLRLDTRVRVTARETGFALAYETGLKRQTIVEVEAEGAGSALRITDDYTGTPEVERRARLAEVDTSLSQWGAALHEYLRRHARWSRLAPWAWYMRRVWLPLKPSQRRIVYILWVVTLFELATLVAVLAVWSVARK